MRLRTLLSATAASAIIVTGLAGAPAHADQPPDPAAGGIAVAWGDPANTNTTEAIAIPDLDSPVLDVATSNNATALVTADGHLTVLGAPASPLVTGAPDVTDAVAVTLAFGNVGAVLHADGTVSAWGAPGSPVLDVPGDLHAKAIALSSNTGYAVRTDGTLATWGNDPTDLGVGYAVPDGLSDLVDVSANNYQVMALKADGTVSVWGYASFFPDLITVPDFGGKKVAQISAGTNANGVVFQDGSIQLWGNTVPAGQPDFGSHKVTSLSVGSFNTGAVTDDGVVHTWGPKASVNTLPEPLEGQPVSAIAVGETHAAAIITTFRKLADTSVTGDPTVGQTLTAAPATYTLLPDSETGQWFAGDDAVEGQTGTTLELDASMIGKSISYHSTATRGDVSVDSVSDAVGPVVPATAASTTKLTVRPVSAAIGKARTVTVTVTKPGGTATGSVTFKTGSKTKTVTLANGKAIWKLPKLTVGSHKVTASYAGDATTDPSTAAPISLKVTKAAPGLKVSVTKSGKTRKYAKKVKVHLTVKTPAGVSPKGKVTVILKGKTKKTVHAKVGAKGKVTVTVKKVKHGKYKAVVKYAGNKNVKASKTTKKFKA